MTLNKGDQALCFLGEVFTPRHTKIKLVPDDLSDRRPSDDRGATPLPGNSPQVNR